MGLLKSQDREQFYKFANRLNISHNTIREGLGFFRKLKRQHYADFRGFANLYVAYASLLYVIRRDCIPITQRVFFEGWDGFDIKDIVKIYRRIIRILNANPKICRVRPTIFIETFLEKLQASPQLKRKVAELNRKVIDSRYHLGKDPSVVAAQVIYLAAFLMGQTGLGPHKITMPKLRNLILVTDITIGKYRTLAQALGIKLPPPKRNAVHTWSTIGHYSSNDPFESRRAVQKCSDCGRYRWETRYSWQYDDVLPRYIQPQIRQEMEG